MSTTRRERVLWPVAQYAGVEIEESRAYRRLMVWRYGRPLAHQRQYNWVDVTGRRRPISARGLAHLAWRAGAEIGVSADQLAEERAAMPYVDRWRSETGELLRIPCSNYRVCFDDEGLPFIRSWAAKSPRTLGGALAMQEHPKDGRPMVVLVDDNGRPVARQIGYWVLTAHVGPAADRDHSWVLHRNGDCMTNSEANLRWGSARENHEDMLAHGVLDRTEAGCYKRREAA